MDAFLEEGKWAPLHQGFWFTSGAGIDGNARLPGNLGNTTNIPISKFSSILTLHNNFNLISLMRRTKLGLTGVCMTTTLPHNQFACQEVIGIDPGLSAVTKMATAASKVQSSPQTIFKFHPPSSLDYRACNGLPIKHTFENQTVYEHDYDT